MVVNLKVDSNNYQLVKNYSLIIKKKIISINCSWSVFKINRSLTSKKIKFSEADMINKKHITVIRSPHVFKKSKEKYTLIKNIHIITIIMSYQLNCTSIKLWKTLLTNLFINTLSSVTELSVTYQNRRKILIYFS